MTDNHPPMPYRVERIIAEAQGQVDKMVGHADHSAVIELLATVCWLQQIELEKGGFRRHLKGEPGGERQDHDPHGVNR